MVFDHKIIEDCKTGKRRAQSKLYKRFAGVMLGVCMRYSRNVAEAEDILQEGFIKVFENINKLKENDALEGWIRRIMVNTAITHTNKKRIYFEKIDEASVNKSEDTDDVYLPVDPADLIAMIQNLPEGYRVVLNLYVFEGYSHKQIALALGIRINTSKTQLFKARKHLRKVLENRNLVNQNLVENETRI